MKNYKYLILSLLLLACNTNTYTQPLQLEGYNWGAMEKLHLEHKLDEVSGIVFGNKSRYLLAINDEQGIVYRVGTNDYKIMEAIKFGKGDDYEAIGRRKNRLFVMNSKGDLWRMKLTTNGVQQVEKYKLPIKERIEFEAMVWPNNEFVYLISKKSNLNKEKNKTHVYAFSLKDKAYKIEPVKEIVWADVRRKSLHVSDAAIHPTTQKVYLIASIEKLLIILNSDWEVEEVHELDKKLFKQPEGIAFDKEANLYISNEAKGGRPNIIKIPIKKQQHN